MKANLGILESLMFIMAVSVPSLTQTRTETKLQAEPIEKNKERRVGSLEAQRAFAISLVTSVANDARSYGDLILRTHVLAQAADTLWNADRDTARTFFLRAWEAAEKGDTEELTKTKDSLPPMVIGLRRASGRDLRLEVLILVARRDRLLGEELLAKLKNNTEREAKDSDGNTGDSWSASDAATKRLALARRLLDEGQVDRALEFAAPALNQVNAKSIGFLSALRGKQPELADQKFVLLLARAELDPSSDANTASGLSSYAFTPAFYVTFSSVGGASWSQESETNSPPNLPPVIRARFFQTAAAILMRPLRPPDQDNTTSGRVGKLMVIKRLLPLFDQYAPDMAIALRAQMVDLTNDVPANARSDDNSLLTKNLPSNETSGDTFQKMQDRVDHANTSKERNSIYADAAATLAEQGDARAQDVAEKIDDPDLRAQVRRYVDIKFIQIAIQKKNAAEVGRLASTGQLTHLQRAWAYIQAAQLVINSQRTRSLEFLEEAAKEARRIDAAEPDRARALIGVATQFITADGVRAWEIMDEAIKSANSTKVFSGEDVLLYFPLATKSGLKIIDISGDAFRLEGIFRLLTKNDLYRALDLAKSFKDEGPRATAVLTIADVMLKEVGAQGGTSKFRP
jgi:hypothetical protein